MFQFVVTERLNDNYTGYSKMFVENENKGEVISVQKFAKFTHNLSFFTFPMNFVTSDTIHLKIIRVVNFSYIHFATIKNILIR